MYFLDVKNSFLLSIIILFYFIFLGLPCSSDGKESASNEGDWGDIPESGRSSGEGNGNSLQYSYHESPMYRGAW